jgi:hypothetical protein
MDLRESRSTRRESCCISLMMVNERSIARTTAPYRVCLETRRQRLLSTAVRGKTLLPTKRISIR